MIIVKSKIKNVVGNLNVSSDVAAALEKKVLTLIDEGCQRAKANKRNTLMGKDI